MAATKKNVRASYGALKRFGSRQYSGMRVGGVHNWEYQPGTWKERKVTPDKWAFGYTATKRRKGHAPKGSGAPVGTEYHWYILAHQRVRKLDENTYATEMEGDKFKLAHKRAGGAQWSTWSTAYGTSLTAKKKLAKILEEELHRVRTEVEAEELEKEQAKEEVAVKAVSKRTRRARQAPLAVHATRKSAPRKRTKA